MAKLVSSLLQSNDIDLQIQGIRLAVKTQDFLHLPQLIKLSTSLEPETAEAATQAAVLLAQSCIKETHCKCPETIVQAAIEIVKNLAPEFIQELHAHLNSSQADLVRHTLISIKHFVNERKAEEILTLMKSQPDPTLRATAIQHLGYIASRRSPDILMHYLQDTEPRVLASTIDIFGKVGNQFHTQLILPFKNSVHPRIRANALKTLFMLGYTDLKDDFLAMLGSKESSMRASAVWAIGEVGSLASYYLKLLENVKSDTSEAVRNQLFLILKKLSAEHDLEFLREALHDDLKISLRTQHSRKNTLTASQVRGQAYTLIKLSGSCTTQTLLSIKVLLEELAQKEKHFILDLDGVDYIDSTGVGLLLNFHKTLRKKGGLLYLYGCNDQITELFHLSRVDSVLEIHTSFEEIEELLKINTDI